MCRQDYTDDFESLFYGFCNVVALYERPGVMSVKMRNTFRKWDAEHSEQADAITLKKGFTLQGRLPRLSLFWGPPCDQLLKGFHHMIRDLVNKKSDLFVDDLGFEERRAKLNDLGKNVEVHYATLLKMFDEALEQIQLEDNEEPSRPQSSVDSSLAAALANRQQATTLKGSRLVRGGILSRDERPGAESGSSSTVYGFDLTNPLVTLGDVELTPDPTRAGGRARTAHDVRAEAAGERGPRTAGDRIKKRQFTGTGDEGSSNKRQRGQDALGGSSGSGAESKFGDFEDLDLEDIEVELQVGSGSILTD